MAHEATAGSRIVQGFEDLQTFRSQLEHVRGLMRILDGRRSRQPASPQPAGIAEPRRAGLFGRFARQRAAG